MSETNLPNGSQWESNKTYPEQEQSAQDFVNDVRATGEVKNCVKINNKLYDCRLKDGVLVCLPCKP